MEQRGIEALSGARGQRENLDQVANLDLLGPAFQDWLALQGQLVFQVKLDHLVQRVSWDHLDLQDFLDLLASQALQGSSLVEKREVQTSSVLLTVQQELKAPRDCRESRDTKDVVVFSESLAASENRVPGENWASLGSRASQDLRVQWA